MHALTSYAGLEPRVLARLQHQRVAMLASAEVLRRTRHPRAARQLLTAAEDLAAELDAVKAVGHWQPIACPVCGRMPERARGIGCDSVSLPTGVDLCIRCADVVVGPGVASTGQAGEAWAVLHSREEERRVLTAPTAMSTKSTPPAPLACASSRTGPSDTTTIRRGHPQATGILAIHEVGGTDRDGQDT